ncbi:Homocysteine S-methyltransferase 2-like protein [Drosera capensis]
MSVSHSSPLSVLLRRSGGVAVLDGGLATELERHGADLNDPLWSAKCLLSSPHLLRQVHLDYLEAGADIIITASYQGTVQGFKAKGFSQEESEALLKKSVEIACEARDIYYNKCSEGSQNDNHDSYKIFIHRPVLVAASVGSYGAYLADGSEYSIPVTNGKAYAELLDDDNVNIPAWLSFNSKDGINVVSGDSLLECTSVAENCKKIIGVGINCTPPRFIHGLISSVKKVTTKPVILYPNSGERYDPDLKEWVENTGLLDEDFVSYVNKWHEAGASLIGGCCRTTPNTIRAIYKALHRR